MLRETLQWLLPLVIFGSVAVLFILRFIRDKEFREEVFVWSIVLVFIALLITMLYYCSKFFEWLY